MWSFARRIINSRFRGFLTGHAIGSETNAIVRVDQSQHPSGFGPVCLASTRYTRPLSRRKPGKPFSNIGWHLGAQTSLQVLDAQVLGGLIQAHQVGREIRRALLPPSHRNLAAVTTSDSNLVQHDGLVFPTRKTHYVILSRLEEFNVLPKKDLVFVQHSVISWNIKSQPHWIMIFCVIFFAVVRCFLR